MVQCSIEHHCCSGELAQVGGMRPSAQGVVFTKDATTSGLLT